MNHSGESQKNDARAMKERAHKLKCQASYAKAKKRRK